MKKKWLKGMAALLSAALLVSLPGLLVKADYMTDGGIVEVTEAEEQIVRSVSGGDADIIYPAPSMEWQDNWNLRLDLPEVASENGSFEVNVYKDDASTGGFSWSNNGGKTIVPVYWELTESGLYSFTGCFYKDGIRVSEVATVEREYVAPAEKLRATTAIWHDGSIPMISFRAVPHANYYLIDFYKDNQWISGIWYDIEYLDKHEDGTLWLWEREMEYRLSDGAGDYAVTIKAVSENVELYANGDTGIMSDPYAFDGTFRKISTNDILEVKAGLVNEKVTDIEYSLPAGTEVSEADQKEIFAALKGTDKSLTFSFRGEDQTVGYQWTFDGAEIADEAKVMDFQIIVDANVQEVINCIDNSELNEVDLAFLHEGTLPGKATVTVNLQGKLGDAQTAHLYYYNPETKQLEVVAENLAITNGYVAFPMTHCSNYILTAEMLKDLIPNKEPAKPDPDNSSNNNTNHNVANNAVSVQVNVEVEPVGESVISYIVESGDTLKKIAAKFYGSSAYWTKIYKDNAGTVSNPNRIYVGQVLYIYLGENSMDGSENIAWDIYIVQPGDSLWKIAKKLYGKGQWCSRIYEVNKDVISNPKRLYIGQKIVIPQ